MPLTNQISLLPSGNGNRAKMIPLGIVYTETDIGQGYLCFEGDVIVFTDNTGLPVLKLTPKELKKIIKEYSEYLLSEDFN